MSLLGTMTSSGWRPGPGDPTLGGWLVVAGYAVGTVLCWLAAHAERRAASAGRVRLPGVWYALAGALFLLGLNKQLDLHTAITWIGRELAGRQGWYQSRRTVQLAMILVLAVSAAAAIAILYLKVGRRHPRYWVPLVGVAVLGTFVLVRAASFHHADALLSSFAMGLKVHAILELTGILVLGVAAWRTVRSDGRGS